MPLRLCLLCGLLLATLLEAPERLGFLDPNLLFLVFLPPILFNLLLASSSLQKQALAQAQS